MTFLEFLENSKNTAQANEAAAWMSSSNNGGGNNDGGGSKLSGYAQKALAATQKEAGGSWDNIKDKYTKTLAAVDAVLGGNLKQTVADTLKITGANMDTLVAKLTDMTMNLQQFGDKVGQNVTAYTEDTSGSGVKSLTPMVSLMCAALQANKGGMKPSDIVTLINAVSK